MAGVIGLRGPDIEKRDALRGYKVEWRDADRPFVRPHTGLPVLHTDEEGEPVVTRHVFGFTRKFTSFNARADRLESGKMWSRLFGKQGRHGIAPVSYILEWADLGPGVGEDRAGKRAWRIERADGAVMCVPALVGSYWEDRDQRAFSLISVDPNRFVGRIHDRMIAQLPDELLDVWLHPEDHDHAALLGCLGPGPDEDLIAVPLSADAGRAKHDDPAALEAVGEPLTWDELRALPGAEEGDADGGQATLGDWS